MNIKFFEGFNYSDSDITKLDPAYWSSNRTITFASSRTGNGAVLESRPADSGLNNNTVLTLSNFNDPLISHSGFCVGFNVSNGSLLTKYSYSDPEQLISFHDNNDNVLSVNIIKSSYDNSTSLALAIYENNTLIESGYDLKSIVGNSFNIEEFTWGDESVVKLNNDIFIEIFIDAKNTQQMSINVSANSTNDEQLLNSNNNAYTTITGFSNLSGIKFYSTYDWDGYQPKRTIDDLYINATNSTSSEFLGSNTHIYALPFNLNASPVNWSSHDGSAVNQFNHLNSNDGDASYAYSDASGDISLFNVSDLANESPSNVGGIRLSNIIKKTASANNANFTNIINSGAVTTNIGDMYNINSSQYSQKNSFIFINPLTSAPWTKADINNMKIGIKNLGNP